MRAGVQGRVQHAEGEKDKKGCDGSAVQPKPRPRKLFFRRKNDERDQKEGAPRDEERRDEFVKRYGDKIRQPVQRETQPPRNALREHALRDKRNAGEGV